MQGSPKQKSESNMHREGLQTPSNMHKMRLQAPRTQDIRQIRVLGGEDHRDGE